MGVIYKITNKINNKIYIGKTVTTEPQRWQQHLFYAYNDINKDCPYLCNAIIKYGKENFTREVIETVDNSLLLEREKFWIDYYGATDHNIGYNLAKGGQGHVKFEDEEILWYYNQCNQNISEASRVFNISRSQMTKRLQALGIITTKEIPIEQYNFKGELINTYQTAEEAARALGVKGGNNICSSTSPCAYGYIWRRINNPLSINEIIQSLGKKHSINRQIEQYAFSGELIKIYESAQEASKETGIDCSCIKTAASGKGVMAGGFLWRRTYGDVEYSQMIKRYLLSPLCCEVDEIDEKGNIINTFQSANMAEKYYGWGGNSVKPVCDGKKKHTRKKFFQWHDKRKRELINGIE